MSTLYEGASISRPLLLYGTNYPYWKTKMKAFIRALELKAWRSILTGWTPPSVTNNEGKTNIKPEIDWSMEDD